MGIFLRVLTVLVAVAVNDVLLFPYGIPPPFLLCGDDGSLVCGDGSLVCGDRSLVCDGRGFLLCRDRGFI